MLQFGGHHLALNITIMGERGGLTLALRGLNPVLTRPTAKRCAPLVRRTTRALPR
jgi:hypothetical protein